MEYDEESETLEPGTCTALLGEGDSCDSSWECLSGLKCDGATHDGSNSGECAPLNLGESCESHSDCDEELECDEDEGICVESSGIDPEKELTCTGR